MSKDLFLSLGFEQLGEEIYVYHNFISEDKLPNYNKAINTSINADRVNTKPNGLWQSDPIEYFEIIRHTLKKMIGSEYIIGQSTAVNILNVGEEWHPHSDNVDYLEKRKLASLLDDGDEYDIITDKRYGIVIYFQEFGGGELYYTKQNISYKPKPGDLVIHSSEEICEHGVKPVTDGVRYSYSNHLSVEMKIPKASLRSSEDRANGFYP